MNMRFMYCPIAHFFSHDMYDIHEGVPFIMQGHVRRMGMGCLVN
jgi:hypothetical protein